MKDCTQHLKTILFLLVNAKIIVPACVTQIINAESLLGRAFAGIDMQQLLEFPWTNVVANKDKQRVYVNKTDAAVSAIKVPNGLYSDLGTS